MRTKISNLFEYAKIMQYTEFSSTSLPLYPTAPLGINSAIKAQKPHR